MLRDPDTIIDEVSRSDWGRIVASLIRLVNVFDVAEEAVQEAFAAALAQWRSSGVPESPQAWIVQTARHTAIDRIRRRARFSEKLESYVASGLITAIEEPDHDTSEIPDDRLRLIFTCYHPALASEAQTAITCSMPRVPICSAASDPEQKRPEATRERSSRRPMKANDGSSSGVCARTNRRKRDCAR